MVLADSKSALIGAGDSDDDDDDFDDFPKSSASSGLPPPPPVQTSSDADSGRDAFEGFTPVTSGIPGTDVFVDPLFGTSDGPKKEDIAGSIFGDMPALSTPAKKPATTQKQQQTPKKKMDDLFDSDNDSDDFTPAKKAPAPPPIKNPESTSIADDPLFYTSTKKFEDTLFGDSNTGLFD